MTEWKPRLEMEGHAPHLAYSPMYGYRIVHWECGKGLCNDQGESIEIWFGCTYVLPIPLPPEDKDTA